MMAMLMWRIKSTIGVFDGSDLIHLGLFKFDEWNQVMCAQDGYAQVKRSISICWHPHLMKSGIHGFD